MFIIAIIASKGSVAAGLKVFYREILLKLSCITIKILMCAMLPDSEYYKIYVIIIFQGIQNNIHYKTTTGTAL